MIFNFSKNMQDLLKQVERISKSKALMLSLGLHALAFGLIVSTGYLKSSQVALQPQIEVDLVDIEFTLQDQDLSKIKTPKAPAATNLKPNKTVLKTSSAPKLETAKGPKDSVLNPPAKKELQNLTESESVESSGDPNSAAKNSRTIRMSYDQYLVSYINKYKTYPRIAERLKQQGVVISKIVITKEGQLKDVMIDKSSGFSSLDQGTLNLIKSLAPFKPLPDQFKSEYQVNIPIEYILAGY